MSSFTAEVFQNEFLADGATDVHAIVTVECTDATQTGPVGDAAEVLILDTSGSMSEGDRMAQMQRAAVTALAQIQDGTWFAVIGGADTAFLVYPSWQRGDLVRMDPVTRAEAQQAVQQLRPDGGTAMGRWLLTAAAVFSAVPNLAKRHAILLTDGMNQHERRRDLNKRIAAVTGKFQCDCRGVGADWQVDELRHIAAALLGSVDLVAQPENLAQEFAGLINASAARTVAAAELRVWAPQGAQVLFVRQVSPTVEDLTARRAPLNPLTSAYPTGAWGAEARDYHVAVRLPAAQTVGAEQLAARVQLAVGDQVVAQGLVKARWSDNSELTARINPEVAHYTGQTELAAAIQDGLAARAAGDEATATAKLGRAVQLAEQTGNADATSKLRKVVEVEEAATGKVRLKRQVDRLDEMALDTASTKTSRVRR